MLMQVYISKPSENRHEKERTIDSAGDEQVLVLEVLTGWE